MERIDSDELYQPRTWEITPGFAGRWINLWGEPPAVQFYRSGPAICEATGIGRSFGPLTRGIEDRHDRLILSRKQYWQ
jgi:hypothetical protein